MSALAAALTAAGYAPPMERLRLLAVEAVKASPRNWDGAKDELYKRIRNDAALLWELFAPYRAQAVQALLTEAAAEVRAEEMPRVMPRPSGAGQIRHADLDDGARPTPTPRHRPPPMAGLDAIAAVTRLSLLDTFKVNGRPIGDLTPTEANGWAASRERDARFVRLLTQNLPADAPIRKWRTAEEAQELYGKAGETADA